MAVIWCQPFPLAPAEIALVKMHIFFGTAKALLHSLTQVHDRSGTLKSLANLSLNLMVAIIPFGIAVAVASEATKPAPAVSDLDLSAPALWTSQPVAVTDKLAYERIPGVQYAEVDTPTVKAYDVAGSRTFSARSEILEEATKNVAVDMAGVEACSSRYRSYRVEDNTYQPYDGGPRRLCALRQDQAETANADGGQVYMANQVLDDSADPRSMAPAHVEWCSARYRSYDPTSDSYRSFSGSRRSCVSPFN